MLLAAAFLFREPPPDRVPDVLKDEFDEYFDQGGFSFAPGVGGARDDDRVARFRIGYQNRRSGRCVARIVCWPVDGLSKTGPHEVPPVTSTIACDGGEAGVVEIPYPFAQKWQGQEMIYDVACSAAFPEGRGEQLSEGEGKKVGKVNADAWDPLVTGALLLIGHLRFSTPASVRLILPCGVTDVVPAGATQTTNVLYSHEPAGAQLANVRNADERGDHA